MLKSPPIKDVLADNLTFSTFLGSKENVGMSFSEIEADHRYKQRRKFNGRKGGILRSSEIFGCENEQTDLRNEPRESFFDKTENCLHGTLALSQDVATSKTVRVFTGLIAVSADRGIGWHVRVLVACRQQQAGEWY
jgi:hypothetical protein